MRHRIKAGKVGSFAPEKQKVEMEQQENRDVADEVEEIFEEDSEFSNDDEALAAMEFFDSPDEME
jgi:chaperonin cofactor prefoldin